MSQKHPRENAKATITSHKNVNVTSKCVAIVLNQKLNSNGEEFADASANETVVDSVDLENQKSQILNGKVILHDFKLRNKTCYWNPSLVESIKSLEYKGFLEPCTILVAGADIHLENLRSAWGRRVLKPPAGFSIRRIGDVNDIEIQVIPQTQFTPLPDALCNIVLELNNRRIVATLPVICERLTAAYRHMTVPSQQLVDDTIRSLMKDRKLFHTGSGYFVVTPDTSVLSNSNTSVLPTNASWLPYHPMYVPVFQGQVQQSPMFLPPAHQSHMRSISCQVTTIEESEEELENEYSKVKERPPSPEKTGTLGRSSRSQSLRRIKDAKPCRVEVEKTTKPDDLFKRAASIKVKGDKKSGDDDKIKGEKRSLFSKIFGRKKKLDKDAVLMPPPPPPPPLPIPPSSSSECTSEGKGSVKEKEYATFSAQFPPPEWMWYQQQLDKQERVESWVSQQHASKPTRVTSRPPVASRLNGGESKHFPVSNRRSMRLPSVPPGNADYVPMSSRTSDLDDLMKSRAIPADNLYDTHRHPTSSKHRHHRSHRRLHDADKLVDENLERYDIHDNEVTRESNVYHSVSGLSPVAPFHDDSHYSTYREIHKLGPLHSTPRNEGKLGNDRLSYGVEGREARDRIYGPPDASHRRRSHRSRRRSRISYYQGDDISYEYKGRMPRKNSSRAQSRDSGVNCIGTEKAQSNYENTNRQKDGEKISDNQESTNPSQYESTSESIQDNQTSLADPAFNSVIYGSIVNDSAGGPSVMYHTVTYSALESSGMPAPQPSLQSGFYDESHLANPKMITCDVEINHNVANQMEELHCTDLTDDQVSPSLVRNITGCSIIPDASQATDDSEKEGNVTTLEAYKKSNNGHQSQETLIDNQDSVKDEGMKGSSKSHVEGFVSDSGFSSPRNPETHVQSNNATDSSDSQQRTKMAATDNRVNSDTKHIHKLNTLKKQAKPNNLHKNVSKEVNNTAKVVSHPDSNLIEAQLHRVPLHPNSMRLEKVYSEDMWRNMNANDPLTKLKEEQQSKKYEANGEFHVIGVL